MAMNEPIIIPMINFNIKLLLSSYLIFVILAYLL